MKRHAEVKKWGYVSAYARFALILLLENRAQPDYP